MEITEVRFQLIDSHQGVGNRLRAFCTVTLDDEFVVRDLRIIEGQDSLFVAMPSRKLRDRCPKCGTKNHLRARFCNECGGQLNANRAPCDQDGRVKLHSDIAHPLNAQCRKWMESHILDTFKKEIHLSEQPDYAPPRYYGDQDDEGDDLHAHSPPPAPPATVEPPAQPDPPGPESPKGFADGIL